MNKEDIYQLMLNKCPSGVHNIHYLKRYIKFIFNCIENNKTLDENHYTEKHHILPKSIWPDYKDLKSNQWNCSILTARQHFLAHWMLSKCYGGRMWYAASYILFSKNVKIGSRLYEILKIKKSQNPIVWDIKAANDKRAVTLMSMYGVDNASKSEIIKDRIKKSMLLSYGVDNCSKSDIIKQRKIDTTFKNYGVTHHNKLDYNRDRLSETMKKTMKNVQSKVCPHCAKSIKGSNYTKWHGDNCKKNPNRIPILFKCFNCGFKSENKGMISRFHNHNCKH